MGWRDWFKAGPTNIENLPDAVWLNSDAKYAGIAAAIRLASAADSPRSALALVAHFPETLHALRRIVAAHSVPFLLEARLAAELSERDFTTAAGASQRPIEVLVAERHPHERADAALVLALQRTPYQYRVTYHHSFDDALFQLAGAERARKTLQMLGMNESEPIHSKAVVRKLRQMQRKIAKQASGNVPAKSATEWMRLNLPPT